MSFSFGSFTAWSNEGAYIVPADVVTGCRSVWTRPKNPSPSKVNSAPLRAWAVSRSGMADSCARVR